MTTSNATEPGGARPLSGSKRPDIVAGLLVFLIALPLCLAISNASGFPAINGVFSAIAGGIICSLLSNAELTIKGPAAGMIAIVLGAVTDFAASAGVAKDALSNTDALIYLKYLPDVCAVAVVAGVIQILFGLVKAGSLADLFPTAVIHGLLASIGLIIIGKQVYLLLGLRPNASTEAYEAYVEFPEHMSHFAWQAALMGGASLVLLFMYPQLKKRFALCRSVPAQLIILAIAIPVAQLLYEGFAHGSRSYEITHDGHVIKEEVKALFVKVPVSPLDLEKALIFPSFQHIGTRTFWKWVLMFTLVGSLESLLSAKAVDVLDPWKRKSDLNRDLLSVGIANTAIACVGGLPMISEIVRSSANRDYGAETRWSNFFHGTFLLISIFVLPSLLNKIPLTALAAMLIYAGCRLASYQEFVHAFHIGKEQLVIFLATIAGVLATDLLIGVAIGIVVKIVIELLYGVKPGHFIHLTCEHLPSEHQMILKLSGSIVFTNWLMLRHQILVVPKDESIIVDFTNVHFIDHTAMSRLEELRKELIESGRQMTWQGLDSHRPLSSHPLAARRK